MLFNSLAFMAFLPVVFVAYWWLFPGLRKQNVFVLFASWSFYAWWDWRFLGLLLISSLGDYWIGRALGATDSPARRKNLLRLSIALNLGMLGFFKYFDFFIAGFAEMVGQFGFHANMPVLNILLPVGISFYTFQTLSYTIDIYRGVIKPTRDPVAFAAFVAFFPQLVAGPIERARDLLPQFEKPRAFSTAEARDGLRQMLWGFFKKIVVADTCGPLADAVFAMDPGTTSGTTLLFGVLCFAFQIYGDFSGYSDIAIGCARLFGFRLSRNFNYPYFARDIAEFWRRWHISLSSWFRDYVYISLGGWRGRWGRLRNIMITFAASGLWHGANWTFITWGALHGAYYLPGLAVAKVERSEHAAIRDLPRILLTFVLVLIAWVFFRAPTVGSAFDHLWYMVANAGVRRYEFAEWLDNAVWGPVLVMFTVEWNARRCQHGLAILPKSIFLRWSCYLALVVLILLNIDLFTPHAFIYFRF